MLSKLMELIKPSTISRSERYLPELTPYIIATMAIPRESIERIFIVRGEYSKPPSTPLKTPSGKTATRPIIAKYITATHKLRCNARRSLFESGL